MLAREYLRGSSDRDVLAAIDGDSKCGVAKDLFHGFDSLSTRCHQVTSPTSPLFEDMHDLRITVLKEPEGTPLAPDAALLVSR